MRAWSAEESEPRERSAEESEPMSTAERWEGSPYSCQEHSVLFSSACAAGQATHSPEDCQEQRSSWGMSWAEELQGRSKQYLEFSAVRSKNKDTVKNRHQERGRAWQRLHAMPWPLSLSNLQLFQAALDATLQHSTSNTAIPSTSWQLQVLVPSQGISCWWQWPLQAAAMTAGGSAGSGESSGCPTAELTRGSSLLTLP